MFVVQRDTKGKQPFGVSPQERDARVDILCFEGASYSLAKPPVRPCLLLLFGFSFNIMGATEKGWQKASKREVSRHLYLNSP